MTKEKTLKKEHNPKLHNGVVGSSLHQMRAINTFKEMEKELLTLKNDVSFREYVGFERCMQIFYKKYEKWIV